MVPWVRRVHWLPVAAVTDSPKLSVLDVLQLWKSKVCNESYRAKMKVSAGLISPGDFKQNPLLFSFSFRKLLAFLGLWSHHSRLYFYPHFALSTDWFFLHPFIKTLVITSGPLDNPGSLPHLKILKVIPLPSPFCHFYRFWWLEHGHVWEPLSCLPQRRILLS